MFKDELCVILEDLHKYPNDRAKLFGDCIKERLDDSLNTYYKTLTSSLSYLELDCEEKEGKVKW